MLRSCSKPKLASHLQLPKVPICLHKTSEEYAEISAIKSIATSASRSELIQPVVTLFPSMSNVEVL